MWVLVLVLLSMLVLVDERVSLVPKLTPRCFALDVGVGARRWEDELDSVFFLLSIWMLLLLFVVLSTVVVM